MKKRVGIIVSAVLCGVLMSGCNQTELKKEVTVIDNTEEIKAVDVISSKVDTFKNMIGYGWTDKDLAVITKINANFDSIKIDTDKLKAEFDVQNIFLFDLNQNKEYPLGDHSKSQSDILMSPNLNYIFYANRFEEKTVGTISDLDGKILLQVKDPDIDGYDFSEARWINNEELIIPCHKIKGFITFNINGKISKIKDVEKGIMGTEDPLNGTSITQPFKVEDKIYYVALKPGTEDDNKLRVYDLKKKTVKNLTEEEVLEFNFMLKKNKILITTYNSKKHINEIILMDVNGENKAVIASGSMFGVEISKNEEKISYINNDIEKSGVYIVDIDTKKQYIAAVGEYYVPMSWNLSGDKIMVHGKQAKESSNPYDEIDTTSIINLNN